MQKMSSDTYNVHRYQGILESFSLLDFVIDYLKLEIIDKDSSKFCVTAKCLFDSSHKECLYTKLGLQIPSIICRECEEKKGPGNLFYDFLDLYPPRKIDQYCEKKRKVELFDENNTPIRRAPNAVADAILLKYHFICDINETLFIYNYKFWKPLKKEYLKTLALEEDGKIVSTQKRRNEISDYILCAVRKPEEIKWNNILPNEIPLNNGVYDLISKRLRAFSKSDHLENVFPVNYNIKAECDRWETYLMQIWNKEITNEKTQEECQEAMDNFFKKCKALQQFMGYILMPHAKYKKCLMLHGKGDTGKSIIGQLLTLMLGKKNVCSIGVDKMDDPRKLFPIKSKYLNLISDLPKSALLSDGGFKQLVSTGDPVQLDGKFRDEETYVPFCKHIFLTNNLPKITDHSGATFNRILILNFDRTFEEGDPARDVDLLDKLEEEKEGVLLWMLEGAKTLLENKGNFSVPQESKNAVTKYEQDENALYEFIQEYCELDPIYCQTLRQVTDAFNEVMKKKVSTNYIGSLARQLGLEIKGKKVDSKNRKSIFGLRVLSLDHILST